MYAEPWLTSAARIEESRSTSTRCPVPPLASTVAKRGEDADRREEPCEDVDNRDPDLLRVALRLARDAHQAAERLEQEVVAGQGGAGVAAKPGDRAVDEPRVRLGESLVAETEAFHHPWHEVLDQHVRAERELQGLVAIARLGQVEGDRALVAVDGLEVGCAAGIVERRSPVARVVA